MIYFWRKFSMNFELFNGLNEGYVVPTDLSRKLTIDGITKAYQVYKIRIDKLFYNDQNDRIATWISKYISEHGNLDVNDIEHYNDIIQDFIVKSNKDAIDKTKKNISLVGQREAGVVLKDGRIIDGNRRFTCLRMLHGDNSLDFQWFEAVILDADIYTNAKQIKLLELMIQHGEESKVDYDPIDKIVGLYHDVIERKLIKPQEYIDSTGMTPSEFKKKKSEAELMVDFLEYINAPKQYYLAREMDLDGPLIELVNIMNKATNEDEREDFKIVGFNAILLRPGNDITRYIRNKIKPILLSEYKNDFIESQNELAEEVLNALPNQLSRESINMVLREDGDGKLVNKLANDVDKYDYRLKSNEVKGMPLKLLRDSLQTLEKINPDIIQKMRSDQLKEMQLLCDDIEEKIDNLREVINAE